MDFEGLHAALQGKLKKAEAAAELRERLAPLASEAPRLRSELSRVERQAERERTREGAMAEARKEVEAATNQQVLVPDLLDKAARAVQDLYVALRKIDSHRREAMKFLAIVDRVDYETEVEEAQEEQTSLGRDTRALAYVYASQHGERRVKELMSLMSPGFSFFLGCDLDNPLRRDVASFVLDHATQDETARKDGAGPTPALSAPVSPAPSPAADEPDERDPQEVLSSSSGFVAEQTDHHDAR